MRLDGDPRRPLHAAGLLRTFADAGVLETADVQVATGLGRLAGETDERVLLAVALAVREVRAGSVCLDLADVGLIAQTARSAERGEDREESELPDAPLPWPVTGTWRAAIEASPLAAVGTQGPSDRPVRWARDRLYLDRYWRDEETVRHEVDARRGAAPTPLDAVDLGELVRRYVPDGEVVADGVRREVDNGRQRLAAATAALARLTVVTGGPGTGKTTTVARLLAVIAELAAPGLRVALTAPTGKAAARLDEAVTAELARLGPPSRAPLTVASATTLHRLLGWRPGSSTRFRHDAANRLPHDVVVVDETSMVSLPLMARLLEALRPQARLVLVGDPDQLVSVEAGAVLGDLVARQAGDGAALRSALREALPQDADGADPAELGRGVVRLVHAHRYGAELARLAEAVRRGEGDAVVDLLRQGDGPLSWVEVDGVPTEEDLAGVRADVVAAGRALAGAATEPDVGVQARAARALRALESHRVLLAHRRGPVGVASWSERAVRWIAEDAGADLRGGWVPGLPLLVTTNDRDTGLFNGDTGVVVQDEDGAPVVAFGSADGGVRLIRPHRLPAVQPVHVMTVHRGQGSQFEAVSVVLPPEGSPLLTRELLYTALTRARGRVRVVGSEAAVRAAVARPVRRASGLRLPG